MRLVIATVLTALLGASAMVVGVRGRNAPERPVPRPRAARRAIATEICERQGPRCRVVTRPGEPRDFSGVGCVCD